MSCSPACVAPVTPVQIVIRADFGVENHKLMEGAGQRAEIEFSIGVKQSQTIRALISRSPRRAGSM